MEDNALFPLLMRKEPVLPSCIVLLILLLVDAPRQVHNVRQGNAYAISENYAAPCHGNVWEVTGAQFQIIAILTVQIINMLGVSCSSRVLCSSVCLSRSVLVTASLMHKSKSRYCISATCPSQKQCIQSFSTY